MPIARGIISYHNNTITVDDVATLEKEWDSLWNEHTTSSDELDFNEDYLQEAYQHMYSHWFKIYEENRSLVSHIDALLKSKEKLECKV